jgi:hypothetical protein
MSDRPVIDPPPSLTLQTDYFNDVFVRGMYSNARWQITEHQFAAGVLLAQVAVEMGARNAFISMLVRRHGPLDDVALKQLLPASLTFLQEDARRLWTDLTGGQRVTQPKDPPVWIASTQHVEYRNKIAHGDRWGDSAGWDCAAAAGAFLMRRAQQMHDVDGPARIFEGARGLLTE